MAHISVKADASKLMQRVQNMAKNGLAAATEQALHDSNYYAPKDRGFLIDSSQTHSDVKKGRLQWVTAYARNLFYNKKIRLKRGKNPNASHEWFEVAKRAHLHDWINAFKKGMK